MPIAPNAEAARKKGVSTDAKPVDEHVDARRELPPGRVEDRERRGGRRETSQDLDQHARAEILGKAMPQRLNETEPGRRDACFRAALENARALNDSESRAVFPL